MLLGISQKSKNKQKNIEKENVAFYLNGTDCDEIVGWIHLENSLNFIAKQYQYHLGYIVCICSVNSASCSI
jgi:hypothetical protein